MKTSTIILTCVMLPKFVCSLAYGQTCMINTSSGSYCKGTQLTANVSDCQGTLEYQWVLPSGGNSEENSVVATQSGVYSVSITSNGTFCCAATVDVYDNPAEPTIISTEGQGICKNQQTTLTASSSTQDLSWNWSSNPPGGIIGNLAQNSITTNSLQQTTSFVVTATNQQGCKSSATLEVDVFPLPVVDAGPDNISKCVAEEKELCAEADNGNSPYSFKWSNGGQAACITVVDTGTYGVTVTDNKSCTDSDFVQVDNNELPTVTADSQISVCKFAVPSVTLSVTSTVGGNSPYVYSWSEGNCNGTSAEECTILSPSVTTTYYVTVTDGNGCTNTGSQVVQVKPLPNIDSLYSAFYEYCSGADIKLNSVVNSNNGSISTFNWTGPGNWASDIQHPTVESATENESGLYTLTAEDTAGCQATKSMTIDVKPNPEVIIQGSNLCFGGTTNLKATIVSSLDSPPLQPKYTWSPVAGSTEEIMVGPLATTTYSLNVSFTPEEKGCKDAADSFTVAVLETPKPAIISHSQEPCPGQRAIYYVGGPTSGNDYDDVWHIQPDAAGKILDTLDEGNMVIVEWSQEAMGSANIILSQSASSCDSTVILPIDFADGSSSGPGSQPIFHYPLNNIFIVKDPDAICYQWWYYDPNVDSVVKIINAEYQAYAAGNAYEPYRQYFVETWHEEGCTGCGTVSTEIIERDDTGPDIEKPAFVLFPNPNFGTFRLTATQLLGERYLLLLTNAHGQTLERKWLSAVGGSIDETIEMENAAGGFYQLALFNEAGIYKLEKFVVTGSR